MSSSQCVVSGCLLLFYNSYIVNENHVSIIQVIVSILSRLYTFHCLREISIASPSFNALHFLVPVIAKCLA